MSSCVEENGNAVSEKKSENGSESVVARNNRNGRKVGILRLKKDYEVCWNFHGAPEEKDSTAQVEGNREKSKRENSKKRKRGMNKGRKLKDLGLKDRKPLSEQLCHALARGDECVHKDNCKFSHDLKTYWETREKDVRDTCVFFEKHGSCPQGVKCLASKSHTKVNEDGIPYQVKNLEGKPPLKKINELSYELKLTLRKKRYSFDPEYLGRSGKTKAVDFSNKIYVAPLTTTGNLPFRRIVKEFGADITCGEMAMARQLLQAKPSEWALVRRHESEDIFGVQLADSDPKILGDCVTMLAKEIDVDFIDLNCGCPIDLVTDVGAGSALMNRTKKLAEIADRMTSATCGKLPIGIKMRIGWNSNKPNAHKLVPTIQTWSHEKKHGSGLAYISIHGRSRQQRYTKVANWDYIHMCCARASCKAYTLDSAKFKPVPVFGNGDIMSFTDWEEQMQHRRQWIQELAELEEEEERRVMNGHGRAADMDKVARKTPEELGLDPYSHLTTCMLARGVLLKPWLPTEIKERRHWDISSSERFDMLKRFADYGLEHWGSDRRGVDSTRRFLLDWISFLHRYVPVGLIEAQYLPQHINDRPPRFQGRNELETLMGSTSVKDWIKISEMLLGPVDENYSFQPKHKANAYETPSQELVDALTETKA